MITQRKLKDGRTVRLEVVGNVTSEEKHMADDALELIALGLEYKDFNLWKLIHDAYVQIGQAVAHYLSFVEAGILQADKYEVKDK